MKAGCAISGEIKTLYLTKLEIFDWRIPFMCLHCIMISHCMTIPYPQIILIKQSIARGKLEKWNVVGKKNLSDTILILDITLVLPPQAMSQVPRVRQVLHLALPCGFFPQRQ